MGNAFVAIGQCFVAEKMANYLYIRKNYCIFAAELTFINNQINVHMKKLFLFLISLFLLSVSMPTLAQDAELVPAMVVQMADGSEEVVQLDYTSVTDFTVLCGKGSLAVSMPEADVTGVRSITFAMVKKGTISSLEEVTTLDSATTDKVLLNGKLYIRATKPNGEQVWYDVLGNLVK